MEKRNKYEVRVYEIYEVLKVEYNYKYCSIAY